MQATGSSIQKYASEVNANGRASAHKPTKTVSAARCTKVTLSLAKKSTAAQHLDTAVLKAIGVASAALIAAGVHHSAAFHAHCWHD